MRLLLKLRPKESHAYINDYHYYMQAAVYSLIREGGMPALHDKKGYKFFCFSNLFPYGDFETGVEKNLLISSPDHGIIGSIERAARARMKSGIAISVNDLRFAISYVSRPFRIKVAESQVAVTSATPIIIRIPRAKFDVYGIEGISYNYLFWRESIPFEAFVNQLMGNIAKKVKEFQRAYLPGQFSYNEENFLPEVSSYRFIRTITKPITVKGVKQIIIGSSWDLTFIVRNKEQKLALEIALDAGLGERNSLGFGFMNPLKEGSL